MDQETVQNIQKLRERYLSVIATYSKNLKASEATIRNLENENATLKAQLLQLNSGQAASSSMNPTVQKQDVMSEDIEMTSVESTRETAEFEAKLQSWSNLLQLEATNWKNKATFLQDELQRANAFSSDLQQQITNSQQLLDETKTAAYFWKFKSSHNAQLLEYAEQANIRLTTILDQKSTAYENMINVGLSERNTLLQRIEYLSSELEEKNSLLAAKDTETTQLLALNNNEKEAALSEAQTELRILKKQLADTQDNLNKTNTEKSLAETQLNAIKTQVNNNNATTGDAPTCTEHDGLTQTYKNKITELETLKTPYKEKTKELQQKIDELSSQSSSGASNAESRYKDLLTAEIEKSKVLQKKNQEIFEKYQILFGQLSRKEADFNAKQQSFNEKISTLKENLTKANEKSTILNEKLQQQESNLETALKDLKAEKNNNKSLNEKITQLNTDMEELKSEVEKTKTTLNIVNQTKTTLQNNYEQALKDQSKLKEDFQQEINEQNTVLNKHIEDLAVKMNSLSKSQNDDLAKEIIEEALEQLRRVNDFFRAQKDASLSINHRIDRQEVDNMKAGSASTKEAMEALSSEKNAAETKDKSLEAEQAKFNEEKANLFVKIGRSLLGFTRMFGVETDQQDAGDKSLVIPQAIQASPVHGEQKFVTEEPQEEEAAELKSPEVPQKKQASPLQEEHKSEVEVPQSDKVELVTTIENETPAAVAEADKLEQGINQFEMTGDDDVELATPPSLRIPKREREAEEEDGTESHKKMK